MPLLTLHPDCAPCSIAAIDATVAPTPKGCHAVFVATGDIGRIRIPSFEADHGRFDNLWHRTCFEIFWQPSCCTQYREFNLSPSTRWACYDFDDFREGMRNAPGIIDIDVSVSATELRVVAEIQSTLPTPALVALNAIIEDSDGVNRFWALAFADGKPEFHSAICRALAV